MDVKIWSETVFIPTYGVGEKDKNPMFLEKRVYQGSSGRVYPLPVIDKIIDEKTDKPYLIVFLENEYIQLQIMPEIGGRIYRALDKTNNYDFVYYNRVIKPALVGLAGPWISGGIEFNWPQHHRPNTFGPVEYRIDDSDPDKKTIWLSETDRMYGTKVTTSISLRKGFAAIEISCQLYNPTAEPQTFLWWANPAVAVHDDTQSIFPPDVNAVMDHGKRDVSAFPIAKGTYYKADYSAGVDISRYKNIAVPTSYMAYHSDYDFVGGYDYRAGAGILHIADHHISPGKKQWTWGNGDFGQAWDKNLTDEDGPYIELMTGVFTDNQPDFTWLSPFSGKNFTQYFMPYKGVGMVKNANTDFVAGMEINKGKATIKAYSPKLLDKATIQLFCGEKVLFETTTQLSPVDIFEETISIDINEWELKLVLDAEGAEQLAYAPQKPADKPIPSPAKAIDSPEKLTGNEALLLAGLHLEQYRHATYNPELYYKEGLHRDAGDIRINNAYGNLLLRRGLFSQAQKLFEAAKTTAQRHSPNPYDGEVFYNLGKALEWQGKLDDAYGAYYKAIWSDAWHSQGYLKLAQISAKQGKFAQALDFAKEAMWANYKNMYARGAAAVLMRQNGQDANNLLRETLEFDPMDNIAHHELGTFSGGVFDVINLAAFFIDFGLLIEADKILSKCINSGENYAMLYYYRAYCRQTSADLTCANYDYCFPNTLHDYVVLEHAAQRNPADAKAFYLLGCLLYDKRRYDDACAAWEKSAYIDDGFPTVHRNLALYYANKKGDLVAARRLLEHAFALNDTDARVFYELCELHKKIDMPLKERHKIMEKHTTLIEQRDDLVVLYVEVLNVLGMFEAAIDLLMSRNFHPWEGGEGKVPTQHIKARLGLAFNAMAAGDYATAAEHAEKALIYFPNFGEGKLTGAAENNIYYTMGLSYKHIDSKRAAKCFEKAASGHLELAGAMYYNDQPPEMIYYQGLALAELGRLDEARVQFDRLISYGEENRHIEQTFDYFAVSLPDFLVFETDLNEKNRDLCEYLIKLGQKGLQTLTQGSK